tara:strand:- start:448 stop:1437 length:990 start_codon:yes stop_codon:yes gene_type:complete
MVYQGEMPHYAHKVFGDSVNCEYEHFEGGGSGNKGRNGIIRRIETGLKLNRGYEIVVAEGSSVLQTVLVYNNIKDRRSHAVFLIADETFHTLSDRKTRYLWKMLKPITNRTINGCISVSDLAYRWCEPHIGSLPCEIVHPPIENEKHKLLSGLKSRSDQEEFTVVSVGNARPSKNYHQLCKSFERFRESVDPKARLILVGSDHEGESYASGNGIETPGKIPVKELTQVLDKSSIYIQPSKADAFPVASLEAMLSATPTIVTDQVGTKELVPEDQVISITEDGIYNCMVKFYNMEEGERIRRGKEHRQHVLNLTEKNQAKEFRNAMERLL